jgi:hypothetical protein
VTKLIREKLGLFAAIMFVLILFSFIAGPGSETDKSESSNSESKYWTFTDLEKVVPNSQENTHVVLQKTMVSNYTLGITYGQHLGLQKFVPIRAYTSVTGFISGTTWEPSNISVNVNDQENVFQYSVEGIIKWKLLGFTIYNQQKSYSGVAPIR